MNVLFHNLDGAIGTRLQEQPRRRSAFLRGIVRALTERRRINRDLQHLAEMPDHMLADIGLTRSEVMKETARFNASWLDWTRF